jgi:hypothetical protein
MPESPVQRAKKAWEYYAQIGQFRYCEMPVLETVAARPAYAAFLLCQRLTNCSFFESEEHN